MVVCGCHQNICYPGSSEWDRVPAGPSDFLALASGQKPAIASHQKLGQAWATGWLGVAYGLGFHFWKPRARALALAPVLGGHRPRQANSHELVEIFLFVVFLTGTQAVRDPPFSSVTTTPCQQFSSLSFSAGFIMLIWCIKMKFPFFLLANHVVLSHSQDLSYCQTDC